MSAEGVLPLESKLITPIVGQTQLLWVDGHQRSIRYADCREWKASGQVKEVSVHHLCDN